MYQSLRCCGHGVEPGVSRLRRLRIVEAIRCSKLSGEPVRRRHICLGVIAHGANALGIWISIKNCQARGCMDKAIQEEGSTVTCIKAVGIAVALQPCSRRVVNATCPQVKCSYLLRVRGISGIGEIGFQIISVPSKGGSQAGPVVINLSEVRVERPVLLHHENDVIHALERAGRYRSWSGRGRRRRSWSRCWRSAGAGAKSLAACEHGERQHSKNACKCEFLKLSHKCLNGTSGPQLLRLRAVRAATLATVCEMSSLRAKLDVAGFT